MRPWDTMMKFIPFRREQAKVGVSWAAPKAAAPVPPVVQGAGLIIPPPQAIPVSSPTPQASPAAFPVVEVAAVQATAPASPPRVTVVPATAPTETTPPAAEESKKLPDKLMNLFLQEEADVTPLQSLTAGLPEVDANTLYETCLETREKLSQRH